jgi:predicted transcriptional regulator
LGTRAIHAGQSPDPSTGAIMVPIYATSTYVQKSPGVHQGYEYRRTQNPTRMAYERCVAELEGGSRGYAFASGLAAAATVLDLLDSGSHVIAMDDLYGGSYRLFERVRRRSAGLDFTFMDLNDMAALKAAVKPNTRMIWAETPTNPKLKLAPIQSARSSPSTSTRAPIDEVGIVDGRRYRRGFPAEHLGFFAGEESLRDQRQGKFSRRPRAAREGRHPWRLLDRHAARRRAQVLPRAAHTEARADAGLRHGNKYLSKMYNDYWMLDNGFLERQHYGDLRDLILRPYSQRNTVVVAPGDQLTVAYQRMKLYDVSQLPVMDGDQIVGIIDESDVLLHVYANEAKFRDPVSTAMVSKLQQLEVKSSIEALVPVFELGHVAIVMDGAKFIGLITRIDLLNYLRRRAG